MLPTIRQLPVEEYYKLDGHEAVGGLTPAPESAIYFVAEDASGTIVAVWCLLPLIHTEPVWIAPHLRKGTLGARLWRTVRSFIDSRGVRSAYSFAGDALTASYLRRLGFTPTPYLTYEYTPCHKSQQPLPPPSSDSA